jgi:formate dehydrogenase maturation protein FdhE
MAAIHSSVGTCPTCNSDIPEASVLIEYEREGEPAKYAECPSCAVVVNPE